MRELGDTLDATDATRLHEFVDDLDALARHDRRGATPRRVLRAVRDDVGLGAGDGHARSARARAATRPTSTTSPRLIAIASVHPDPTTFEPWLREHLQGAAVAADPRRPGEVTLSTVHRVKGMEWDRVVVLGAHDGLMPHRLADDIEEERRMFHVALTRGREQVVLLADEAARAPFVDDLTREPLPRPETSRPSRRLERSRRTAPRAPSPRRSDPTDEALHAWRLERSRADGVPAYVVLSNATVAEIARAQPRNPRELSRISGIGPTKLERYGEDILEDRQFKIARPNPPISEVQPGGLDPKETHADHHPRRRRDRRARDVPRDAAQEGVVAATSDQPRRAGAGSCPSRSRRARS